jgi:sigma54-dependent transcription regulator
MVWRMATLAENGNIDMDLVNEEIKRHREETTPSAENDRPHQEKSAPSTDQKDRSNDLSDRLLSELLGADYESEIGPLDLCQLRYVIEVCSKESIKSAAAASRELFKTRLKHGGNPGNPIRNFFKRKENRKFSLSFKKIKDAAEKLRSTTTP